MCQPRVVIYLLPMPQSRPGLSLAQKLNLTLGPGHVLVNQSKGPEHPNLLVTEQLKVP